MKELGARDNWKKEELEPEPTEKKRVAGAGAEKKFAGSQALKKIRSQSRTRMKKNEKPEPEPTEKKTSSRSQKKNFTAPQPWKKSFIPGRSII